MDIKSLFNLSGKVAIVTGGNRGIGYGIATGLAHAGAAVAILGRNADKNATAVETLQANGASAFAYAVDLTDREALEPAITAVEKQLGPVDILVNNAGNAISSGGVLHEQSEDWDCVMETHVTATFLLSKYAATSMATNGSGKIINIASMYSFFGSAGFPSYSTAKGAIVQLTKSMAIELATHNIQVNGIAPGWIETDMTAYVRELPMNDEIMLRTPAARWGKPEDLAGTAVFLASSASNFVTGSTICVDGGYAIR